MPLEDSEGFTQVAMGTANANQAFANLEPVKHGLSVQFYMFPRQNSEQTLLKGRPIFDETEYVRIMVPGDKASIVERPVRLGHFEMADNVRFAAEYERFKRNASQGVVGTPLSEWPPLSRSHVKELEHFNVHTVEQLAEMSDTHMQKFMGLQSLRELARRFMQHAEGIAPLTKMQAAIDESTNIIGAQKAQMDAMALELAAIKAGQVPGQVHVDAVQPTQVLNTGSITAESPTRVAAPVDENATEVGSSYTSKPLDLEGAVSNADEDQAEAKAAAKPKASPKAKRRSIAT